MAKDNKDNLEHGQILKSLKDIDVPAADRAAKADALKMAMQEFEKSQFTNRQNEIDERGLASHKNSVLKNKKEKVQGLSILTRLMGIGGVKGAPKYKMNRRDEMDNKEPKKKSKKLRYGLSFACLLFGSCSIIGYQAEVGRLNHVQPKPSSSGGKGVRLTTMASSTGAQVVSLPKLLGPFGALGAKIARTVHGSPQSAGVGSGNQAFSGFTFDHNKAHNNQFAMNGAAQRQRNSMPMADRAEAMGRSSVPLSSGAPREADARMSANDPLAKWRSPSDQDSAKKIAPAVPSASQNQSLNQFMDATGLAQEAEIIAQPEITPVDEGRDKFEDFEISPVKSVAVEPVSTFSIDVDTSSYSFMRRALKAGHLPPVDSVRLEELINYFDYNYDVPAAMDVPFQPSVVVTPSPWKADAKLMHIGIKGYQLTTQPQSNLVFLLDVSGSMSSQDKLPLVVESMKLLLSSLKADDTVGIVVYAGAAGVVLQPTEVRKKDAILEALNRLRAGGGTSGAKGLALAYQLAEQNFNAEAVNRIILATDGDFNIGISSHEELKDYVARKRDKGIFLSVLGFGQGNFNDQLMQALAQNGNGVAAYIDTIAEARKVLVNEATSSLFPIAKDVKIQVEFNPASVSEYRLIGYETRALKEEDFNNDRVDAGDIGAGHSVTALYEFVPKGNQGYLGERRYGQDEAPLGDDANVDEYAFLKMRYKLPKEDVSKLIEKPITRSMHDVERLSKCGPKADCVGMEIANSETGWATAVASFGQLLKGGKYTGQFSYDDVIALAKMSLGDDPFGYRAEFINLVELAKSADEMKQ